MWILFSNDQGGGFASVVAKDAAGKPSGPEAAAILSVRFRRAEDAAKLFPGHPYVPTPHGDYAGRVFATRTQVAEVLAREALSMNYDNFKSSLPKADAAIYNACMAGWSVFGKLQPGGPYGRTAQPSRQPDLWSETWDDYNTRNRAARLSHSSEVGASRTDPFCDGCGVRFGVSRLSAGLCPECAVGQEGAQAQGEAGAGEGPEACWCCGLTADDLPIGHGFDLHGCCPECASEFADAGFTEAEILDERDQLA
jgi:hypothetical protein